MKTHERLVINTLMGFALLLSSPAVSVHAETLGAKVISVHGMVEMQGGSPGQWVSAGAPAMLPPGSALRTGPESQAVIELDGSVITLYETSLIRIPTVASQASTGTRPLRHPALDRGRAVFDVTPTPDHVPFSVQTPTIVAGVKGTVFEVVSTGTSEAVYVWRGLVEVSSRIDPDDVELVSAGQFTALDQLRLTLPSEIPFEREMPLGLEKHPDTGTERTHAVIASAPPVSGVLPTAAKPDTLPVDEHYAISSWPDAAHVDALPADIDHTAKFWDAADQTAVQGALDRAHDIQVVVSSGSLRSPAEKDPVVTSSTVDNTVSSTETITSDLLGVLGF
ncbi:MAG TPA: FecR family protein [Nitrospiria bacterium]|nr:FecR family protein [Nitrospiria bacterium]